MICHKLPRHDKKINFGDYKNVLFYSFIAKISIFIEKSDVRGMIYSCGQGQVRTACNLWIPKYAAILTFTTKHGHPEIIFQVTI